MQHLIDSQDVQKIEWFKQGVEDALDYGSDGDRCDEYLLPSGIYYHEGYNFGMYLWGEIRNNPNLAWTEVKDA